MNATISEEHDQTVVELGENIVTENVEEFKSLVDAVLQRRSTVPMILDLGRIDYMCSAGVGIIAGAHRILKANAAELIVRNPSERVSRLLMVTRLNTVLKILGGAPARGAVR